MASQPNTAVLRYRALRPASLSTSGLLTGLPWWRRALSRPGPVSGNTELCDRRMVTSSGSRVACRGLALPRGLALARELALAGEGIVLSELSVARPVVAGRSRADQRS